MAIIQSGLEAVEMRNRMESKEALAAKGSLYVGTGDTTTVTKSDNSTVSIPVTTAFNPPNTTDANGGVMIWDTSVNSTTGWTVDKVGKDNIKDAAITPEKLDPTKEYTVKNITANGNVIIQFERDNVTWGGGGMQYTINGTYGGEMQVPDRSMSVPETFATEEEIKRQIESGEIVAKQASYASSDTTLGTIGERLVSLESSLFYPLCLADEQLSVGTLEQTEIGKGVFYIEYNRRWCILENVRHDGTSYSLEQTLLFGAHTMFQEDNGESQLRIYQAVFTPSGKLTIRDGWLYQPRDEQKAAVVKFTGTKQTGNFYYRKLK